MSRRIIFLLLFLSLIAGMLLYTALKIENKSLQIKSAETEEKVVPTSKVTIKDAELFFVPSDLEITPSTKPNSTSQTYTVDIYINSKSNAVTGVQLELSYDPKLLSNVNIVSPTEVSFFGQDNEYDTLFRDIDTKNGRISYAVQIDGENVPRIGVGKVVSITFNLNNTINSENKTSFISFVNKTVILRPNSRDSVLEKTLPLSINFVTPTPTPSLLVTPTLQNTSPTPTYIPVTPLPSVSADNKEPKFCIQVITPARNPATGECREFPTPCDVPTGWEKVGSCTTQ